VGRTVVVEEKDMDAVTGLSASGPAFAYIILESLAEAGVKVGLPRDVATLLAARSLSGSWDQGRGNGRYDLVAGTIHATSIGDPPGGFGAHVRASDRYMLVGPPGPGIEVRIAESGEVLVRGANVFVGYHKQQEATR
jgi:acyl-CoA synthetase (AMP-forming)/AMP-acid ligase II